MPLLLSEALPTDFHKLLEAQFAAFADNAFHDILWPGPPTPINIASNAARQLNNMALDPHSTFLKITDSDTNTIVGGAKWCIYPTPFPRPARITVDWYGAPESPERAYAQYLLDELHSRRLARMSAAPHCLLDLCFIAPEWQRRGAGALLVEWGVGRAVEMGVEAFVEATEEGRRLYEKWGFVVEEDVRLWDGRWGEREEAQYYFMRRGRGGKGV